MLLIAAIAWFFITVKASPRALSAAPDPRSPDTTDIKRAKVICPQIQGLTGRAFSAVRQDRFPDWTFQIWTWGVFPFCKSLERKLWHLRTQDYSHSLA